MKFLLLAVLVASTDLFAMPAAKVLRVEISERELEFDLAGHREGKIEIAETEMRPFFTDLILSAYGSGQGIEISVTDQSEVGRLEFEQTGYDLSRLNHGGSHFVEKFELAESEFDIKLIGQNGVRSRLKIRQEDPKSPYYWRSLVKAFESKKVIDIKMDSDGFLTRLELENK